MKVYIGPYKKWWGPYQIADLLQYIGISDDRCYSIGKWLAGTWVSKFCNWIESKRIRKIKIRIDDYDTWNADYTLAVIILPVLKQLRNQNHGAPAVDNEDVPEELKSPNDKSRPGDEVDDKWFDRWNYVLDEMIWSFEQLTTDDGDAYGDHKKQKRIENGTRLFGKYYRALWT